MIPHHHAYHLLRMVTGRGTEGETAGTGTATGAGIAGTAGTEAARPTATAAATATAGALALATGAPTATTGGDKKGRRGTAICDWWGVYAVGS